MTKEIRGKNIILREQREADAKYFAYWFNQPQVMFQCGFTESTDEDKEKKAIRKRVMTELAQYPSIYGTYPVVCGVGGTVRALLGLTNEYMGRDEKCVEMSVRELKCAVKQLDGDDKRRLDMIMEIAPDRVRTMMTGIILWDTLLKVFGAETVLVSTSGVREGYLYCNAVEAWDDV